MGSGSSICSLLAATTLGVIVPDRDEKRGKGNWRGAGGAVLRRGGGGWGGLEDDIGEGRSREVAKFGMRGLES